MAIPISEYRDLCRILQSLTASQSSLAQEMAAIRAHQEQMLTNQAQHTAILRQLQHHLGLPSATEHLTPTAAVPHSQFFCSSFYFIFPYRDHRGNRAATFDGIEEGGIRASSSYSHEIDEVDNETAVDGLEDRVVMLKRLTGDIHEEVESHNRMLDRVGNEMDASRGILSGTMERFKMVFETKSSRRMFTLIASFVVIFLVIYYLTR
ncbi:bet1-like SNARE 1-1 [Vitis riparia]|uniref:bet1-like SNARE 1-1 n=1 Tax=Vitis riparia TaxID=96939 RepID=UPI00155ABA4B|nr:bet1-like SNARE 1-1 [Vitis riparia]